MTHGVLVAESDPIELELIATVMARDGFNVLQAMDHDTAKDAFADPSVTLVIAASDVSGRGGGAALCAEVKKQRPGTKFILLHPSGNDPDIRKVLLSRTGCDAVLPTPFRYDALRHLLGEWGYTHAAQPTPDVPEASPPVLAEYEGDVLSEPLVAEPVPAGPVEAEPIEAEPIEAEPVVADAVAVEAVVAEPVPEPAESPPDDAFDIDVDTESSPPLLLTAELECSPVADEAPAPEAEPEAELAPHDPDPPPATLDLGAALSAPRNRELDGTWLLARPAEDESRDGFAALELPPAPPAEGEAPVEAEPVPLLPEAELAPPLPGAELAPPPPPVESENRAVWAAQGASSWAPRSTSTSKEAPRIEVRGMVAIPEAPPPIPAEEPTPPPPPSEAFDDEPVPHFESIEPRTPIGSEPRTTLPPSVPPEGDLVTTPLPRLLFELYDGAYCGTLRLSRKGVERVVELWNGFPVTITVIPSEGDDDPVQRLAASFSWRDGTYKITPTHAPPEGAELSEIHPVTVIWLGVSEHYDVASLLGFFSPLRGRYIVATDVFPTHYATLSPFLRKLGISHLFDGKTSFEQALRSDDTHALEIAQTLYVLIITEMVRAQSLPGAAAVFDTAPTSRRSTKPVDYRMLTQACEEVARTYLAFKERDYFSLLEVTPQASDAEVTEAYERLAKPFKPENLLPGLPEDVTRRAREIDGLLRRARDTLCAPEERRRYLSDLEGSTPPPPPVDALAP